jgi:hypothetical protein
MSTLSQLKKTFGVYGRLIMWWLENHQLRLPQTLQLSTENNPLGYDWVWGLLDNGWMVYYGNILFWIMEGPSMGTFIFSKDGRHYTEFSNVSFRYTKTQYSIKYDFYYPTEMEVTAREGNEILFLRFQMNTQAREYVSRFTGGTYWLSFVICEAPGTIDGWYDDGTKKTEVSGVCKFEPQRQISVVGHNALRINFIKPPKGIGITCDFDSHYLKKHLLADIRFTPAPKISCKMKHLDETGIHKNQPQS